MGTWSSATINVVSGEANLITYNQWLGSIHAVCMKKNWTLTRRNEAKFFVIKYARNFSMLAMG
ncbi:hypothetical protein A9D66_08085 [Xanthomonas citri pv. glycines str. 12-2]|nr:hypothetical protein A9D66_08085 [Xanthomonas citri pv. glycines str. 12-2]ETC88563.1 hypothetical protein XHC_1921 [Xanthomonas hortorum pv. carotae str. M081]